MINLYKQPDLSGVINRMLRAFFGVAMTAQKLEVYSVVRASQLKRHYMVDAVGLHLGPTISTLLFLALQNILDVPSRVPAALGLDSSPTILAMNPRSTRIYGKPSGNISFRSVEIRGSPGCLISGYLGLVCGLIRKVVSIALFPVRLVILARVSVNLSPISVLPCQRPLTIFFLKFWVGGALSPRPRRLIRTIFDALGINGGNRHIYISHSRVPSHLVRDGAGGRNVGVVPISMLMVVGESNGAVG